MKKLIILIIVLLPLVVLSQKALTPFADVEFESGKIIYTLGINTIQAYPHLQPPMFNKKQFDLRLSNSVNFKNNVDIEETLISINDYVDSVTITAVSEIDVNEYLRLCVLLIIVDKELSNHAKSQLKLKKKSGSRQIQQNCKLVLDLLDLYEQNFSKKP